VDPRRPELLTLDVADLERALTFWHGILGVPLKLRGERVAELQTETVLVVLRETGTPETGGGPALGWEVDDLESAAAELERRGVALAPALDDGLGGRRRRFRDPDGHLLELVAFPTGRGSGE
jgi:catechol 2,3-dioxygenase-like lactoylglutathione lyase family enzyme